MRIEQLRLQAFGPYVEEQVIDFSQLQSHLFLIRGETGAGKTAILDAITYAIYGYSSGGDRGEFESMRCRLATQDAITFVECIICIQEHRYRFYRQVEVRKKRNDELVHKTTIDAGELLEDGFHPFFENGKQRIIEEKAQQLIGLSHAQFIQVMMLPQGKFEQLLISSSEAKQEILKSLFQVEKWEDICEYLSEKAKLDKEKLDQIRVQIQMLLQQSSVATIEDFDDTLHVFQEQYQVEQKRANEIHQQYQDVLKQLQIQTQVHALQKRYHECNEELHILEIQRKEMDTLASSLQMYQQYQQVKPYFDAMMQSKQRCKQRELHIQEVEKQESLLMSEQKELSQEASLLERKASELSSMKEAFPALVEEYENFAQYEQLRETYEKKQLQCQEVQAQLLQKQKEQDVKQHQYHVLLEENKRLDECIQEYPEKLKQEQAYANVLQYHQQSLQCSEQIKLHEQELNALKQQLNISKEHRDTLAQTHEQLYQHFLDHSADLLAQSLVDNQPCPVCGSTHHPRSAHVEIGEDVLINLRTCKQALEEAREQTQDIQGRIQVEITQIETLKQQVISFHEQLYAVLANGYDENIHKQLQEACKQGVEQMQKRFDNSKKIEVYINLLQEIEQSKKQLQETSHAYEQEQSLLQIKLEERKKKSTFQDIEHLQRYMQEQKNKIDAYEQEIATNIQKTQENTQAYAIVLSKLTIAKKEYEQEQIHFETAKTNYELQHIEIPQDTKWEEMDVTKITHQLKQYEQRCVEVKSVLQQLISQLEHAELKDIEVVQKQVEQAQAQHQDSTKVVAHYEREIQMLQTNENAVAKLQKKWESSLGAYEQLNSFVKVMRGDNRIGIERYVLGVMLSQITQVANQLLQNVHHGRYQIYRSDETSGRVRKFGLELSIYDTYSCSQRSVVSLSGGEKFLVSLALSLALSTVVQARSGGIYLETMFIDEGFGSLDEQSIADALQVLSAMGQSKAMIGIISHVELLKENIPYGIQVHKQRIGSSLTMLY